MKTIKFFSSMGVTPGFFHNNESAQENDRVKIVAPIWQKHAAGIFGVLGVYPSAIIQNATVVYHTEWGCPEGGEQIVSITGEYNPLFMKQDEQDYKDAVVVVLRKVAKELKQESTQVTFQEMEFGYLDLREKAEKVSEPEKPSESQKDSINEQAIAIRRFWGVSASMMAGICGFGINQWRSYEDGHEPSKSNAHLIRACSDIFAFYGILQSVPAHRIEDWGTKYYNLLDRVRQLKNELERKGDQYARQEGINMVLQKNNYQK